MTANIELPARTRDKLNRFRRLVWRIKLVEGVCAALCGLVLTYIAVFLLDRLFDTPTWLRLALLLLGSLGLGVYFPWKCHRWIWQTRRLDQVARLLKHRMPRLSDRLLGIIELAHSDVEQHRSAVLCAAALRQVDDDIKDTSFDEAVPNPRHRGWSIALAVPATLALATGLLLPTASWSTVQRWLRPWGDTPRYTFAQLEALPDEMVVPLGEPLSISATLSPQSQWTPQRGQAQVGDQPAVQAELDEDRYQFELAPQQVDSDLSITVGDTSKSIQVLPKSRPELKDISAEVQLPEYLQYSSSLSKDVRAGTLSVLKGSRTTLLASATRDLDLATLDGDPVTVRDTSLQTQSVELHQDNTLRLHWQDKFGLTPKSPFELKIETADDRAPNVTCSELSRQQVVLVDEVLTFAVTADDDFGVKQIGIEWKGLQDPLTNPRPAEGSAVLAAGAPETTSLVTNATFSAAREQIEPQTLQVRLYAIDYLPNREPVYSPPYTLFVLSQQDHANWLSERLKTWSRKAQGVYEREVQLYEENKALRKLSSEELQQKATRHRIETQAAAEGLNARQLSSITTSGKQLILEAARNDQFNVATMEGLAEMVTTLEELAKNRMPSVANLLKTAASAKPANQPAKASSQQGPTPPQVGNQRANGVASGEGAESDEEKGKEDAAKPPSPSIVDVESTMDAGDKQDGENDDAQQPPAGQGGSKFGLPTTTVYGDVPQPPADEQPPEDMEEALDEAIEAQAELLEDFTKVAEELQRILDNLEGSTFVKRFKAASRRQTEVARQLNGGLAEKFAQAKTVLDASQQASTQAIVEQEQAEKTNLANIKGDLEAYYQRVQEGKFGSVIREMDELQVMTRMDRLSNLVADNLHGQSIAHAEFWADTFDRWAEQLVGPGCPNGGAAPPGSKGGSLSPAIVLDVMKILEKEIGLRDETRSTETLRTAVEEAVYIKRAESLADTQREIAAMNAEAIQAISRLEEDKGLSFPTEKNMLRQVGTIMAEVNERLMAHKTDAPTIAAETEIIEQLLKVQRKQPPKQKAKGSGGSQPGSGGEGDTEESALALIGRGDESNAQRIERTTRQASGAVEAGYPTEFRGGLDTYFSELEKTNL